MNESKIIIRNLKASFDRGRFARWLLVGILVFGLGWSVNLIWFKPYSIEMFFERTFLRFALNHPEENTEYRMLEILGIHTGHNQLNDITEAQIQRNVDFVIEQYDMLQSYKRSQQTPKELFSTGLLKNYFEDAIYHLQFPYDEFPFDHLKGPHVQVPFFLVNSHLIDKFNDAEDYLDRITKLPKKLKQSEEYARLLMGYNALPPRPIIENMIEQVQIVQEDGTDYNVMYVDLAKKMEVIKGIPEEPLRDLRYFHRRSIEDLILPAYNDFYLFLNEIKGQAPENPSVNRITEDESYYRYLLSRHLTVDNQLLLQI